MWIPSGRATGLKCGERLAAGLPRNLVVRHDTRLAGTLSAFLDDRNFDGHELRVESPLGNRTRRAKL